MYLAGYNAREPLVDIDILSGRLQSWPTWREPELECGYTERVEWPLSSPDDLPQRKGYAHHHDSIRCIELIKCCWLQYGYGLWRGMDIDSCIPVHCDDIWDSLVKLELIDWSTKFLKLFISYKATDCTYSMICGDFDHFVNEASLFFSLRPWRAIWMVTSF